MPSSAPALEKLPSRAAVAKAPKARIEGSARSEVETAGSSWGFGMSNFD
jgi:hypothetical protein